MGYYNTAQVCLNGHVITDTYESNPELRQTYCGKCGEKTIINCPNCNCKIRGDYEVKGVISFVGEPTVDSFCYNCGKPYPWTEEKINSANELLALEGTLSQDELDYFKQNLNSILVDTPKTKVVATKLKLAITKTSSAVGSALRDIFVDIASETAKKVIFPE
ncbi:DUF2321 domain-containing protein [Clostridium perfringens]|uniref:DUF2321 domain-containing protein n=1 Tax=Clostridium perfringens TaxID=1502 RepID=UPI0024BC6AE4|nr:DUF2321 domain-containing protein [Clostridium perfringens]